MSSQDSHCTGSWGCALCFPTSGFFQAALPLCVELDCKNEGCSQRGAPGSSSEQGRSSSLRLQQPPRDPHSRPRWRRKEGTDCLLGAPSGRLPGSGLRGDWCGWRRDRQVLAVEVNQARPGSPATGVSQPCWGSGAPHLLRTPAPRKESHWSAVPALDTLLCPLLVPVASPLTCCSPLLCQGSPSQLTTSVGTAPPAPWVAWHGNPEGLSLKHNLLASAEGTHWGTKGRGQGWDFFVINGKEQVYE